MMKTLKQIYHFLGGVRFAIFLIVMTAVSVVLGTFLESFADSHAFAAGYVYESLLFALLLWGFFFNILIAALRRWPFKRRHIPFLITHTGLLMILGGVLIKHYAGVQGSLFLLEGSASNQLMIPGSLAVRIDSKTKSPPQYFSLDNKPERFKIDDVELFPIRSFKHSSQRLETFIKNGFVFLNGIEPFPLGSPLKIKFNDLEWTVLAARTEDPAHDIYSHFVDNVTLKIKSLNSAEDHSKLSLKEALNSPALYHGKELFFTLEIPYSSVEGPYRPLLTLSFDAHTYQIPLENSKQPFLVEKDVFSPFVALQIDIEATPSIFFLQDEHEDLILATIDPSGNLSSQILRQDNLSSLYSYDHGFSGYGCQVSIPIDLKGRLSQKLEMVDQLRQTLDKFTNEQELSQFPPLKHLFKACKLSKQNFSDVCIDFFLTWSLSHQWLLPSDANLSSTTLNALDNMPWGTLPEDEWKGAAWSTLLLQKMGDQANAGISLIKILEINRWPLLEEIKAASSAKEEALVLEAFTRQVYGIARELPPISMRKEDNAALFSSYCRAYDISPDSLIPPVAEVENSNHLILECPLTAKYRPSMPGLKIEEQAPLLIFGLKKGAYVEQIALRYDREAHGLKQPAGNGQFLLRFQPMFSSIPYTVHLRRARQHLYPNSNQPHSYEGDLIITETKTGEKTEASISMNNVYETWDGYRFYLSGMSPPDESNAKLVQIVVNHDPAKYFLTYPGALILSLGIGLLFWLRPYKK